MLLSPPLSSLDSAYGDLDPQRLLAQIQELQADRTAAELLLQEQLAQSQVRFRTVFDRSPLGQKIVDAKLVIRQANLAAARLLGFATAEELVGWSLLDFVHPDDRADFRLLQAGLWQHRASHFSQDLRLLRPSGAVRWCRLTSVLFADQAGEMGYSTLEGISERKTAEAALQYVYNT